MSRKFGADRGKPIDRYYIDRFLAAHSKDISGHVLEIGEDTYTRLYGGSRVSRSDVLHAASGNAAATIIGNLETGEGVPQNCITCIILTQTYQFIYELRMAIAVSYQALASEGVLLATFPGISPLSRYDVDRWGEYWRLTTLSARKLFSEIFGEGNVCVQANGNLFAVIAFLKGMAVEDLRTEELLFHDPDYELLITVRAKKV